MKSRRYDMEVRDAKRTNTRNAVLAATRRLLAGSEATALTLELVARHAQITRATVYNLFGTRSALLSAVFADLGQRIGAELIHAVIDDRRAPWRAVEHVLKLSCHAWAAERALVRHIFALAVLDDELGAIVQLAERERRARVRPLATRLAGARLLRADVSINEATTLLGALTSFQAYEALGFEQTTEAHAKRLTRTAAALLLDEAPPAPRSQHENSRRRSHGPRRS